MTDRPTTAAGRALAQLLDDGSGTLFADTILAIEAQARQPDSEALRADAIALIQDNTDRDTGDVSLHRDDASKVYAALAALPPSDPPALDVPNAAVLTAILEDVPVQLIEAAKGDSQDALAAAIVQMWPEYARLSAQPEVPA